MWYVYLRAMIWSQSPAWPALSSFTETDFLRGLRALEQPEQRRVWRVIWSCLLSLSRARLSPLTLCSCFNNSSRESFMSSSTVSAPSLLDPSTIATLSSLILLAACCNLPNWSNFYIAGYANKSIYINRLVNIFSKLFRIPCLTKTLHSRRV